MIDELVVENSLSREGVRVLHVMGRVPVAEGWLDVVPDVCRDVAKITRWEDNIHLNHLGVAWAAREVVPWMFLKKPFPLVRKMVLWFHGEEKIGLAIRDAAVCYALGLGVDPEMVLLREIPAKAEEGMMIDGMMLIQASWVPAGFVALIRGGDLAGQVPKMVKSDQGEPMRQERLSL